MLRVHCVHLFYNLSDPGMEELLYHPMAEGQPLLLDALWLTIKRLPGGLGSRA